MGQSSRPTRSRSPMTEPVHWLPRAQRGRRASRHQGQEASGFGNPSVHGRDSGEIINHIRAPQPAAASVGQLINSQRSLRRALLQLLHERGGRCRRWLPRRLGVRPVRKSHWHRPARPSRTLACVRGLGSACPRSARGQCHRGLAGGGGRVGRPDRADRIRGGRKRRRRDARRKQQRAIPRACGVEAAPFRLKWQERALSDLKPRVTTNFFSWICSS